MSIQHRLNQLETRFGSRYTLGEQSDPNAWPTEDDEVAIAQAGWRIHLRWYWWIQQMLGDEKYSEFRDLWELAVEGRAECGMPYFNRQKRSWGGGPEISWAMWKLGDLLRGPELADLDDLDFFKADDDLQKRYLAHTGTLPTSEQLIKDGQDAEQKLVGYLQSGQNGPWSLTEQDIHRLLWEDSA
jgi:hypothetical protein